MLLCYVANGLRYVSAFMPLVMKARTEDVVFLELDSRLSLKDLQLALETALVGCRAVKTYLETSIRNMMVENLTNSSS